MTPARMPKTIGRIRAAFCRFQSSETFKVSRVALTAVSGRLAGPVNPIYPFTFKRLAPWPAAVTKALQDCDVRGVGPV
jgi:hypothetical protein